MERFHILTSGNALPNARPTPDEYAVKVQLHSKIAKAVSPALLLVLFAVFSFSSATQVHAQDSRKPRTLIELLFGNFHKKQQATASKTKSRARTHSKRSSVPNTQTQDSSGPVAKLNTAKHILVVGDFQASALADGLRDVLSNAPGVIVDNKTKGSSGLVRDDYYNWLGELPGILDNEKPAMLIVEIGSNDRQSMAVNGQKAPFHSDAWTAEYQHRVTAITEEAVKHHIPLLWIGIPSYQSPSFTADVVTINLMLRQQTEKAGGTFVDIWEGFVDDNGKFIATGSDMNGQQARLRGSDGLSLTKAGRQKIAFYVEKYIRRIFGDAALQAVAPGENVDLGLPGITMPQSPQNHLIVRTAPISMTDPALDGSATLGAVARAPALLDKSPRDRLVQYGDPGTAPKGRIDDFKLSK